MNEANISQCKFATAIVPYMYGELRSVEASAFESHLLACSGCADEFAAVSASRYEVYEWKKLEFEPLETPIFEIPLTPAVVKVSLVERLRGAFVTGWTPAIGFAAALLVALTAWFTLSSESNPPTFTAGNTPADEVEIPPAPAPSPPAVVGEEETVRSDESSRPSQPIRKAAAPTVYQPRPLIREAKRVNPRPVQPARATTASQNPTLPRLNDFAEDEDKSLRLAELFDDVETSE